METWNNTDYIRPEDRETYDYVWNVAMDLVTQTPENSVLYATGVLLFNLLTRWEKGVLRDTPLISQALSVAMAFREFETEARSTVDE